MSIKSFKRFYFSDVLSCFVHSFQISTFHIPMLDMLLTEHNQFIYYYVDGKNILCEIKFASDEEALKYFLNSNLTKKETLILQDNLTEAVMH